MAYSDFMDRRNFFQITTDNSGTIQNEVTTRGLCPCDTENSICGLLLSISVKKDSLDWKWQYEIRKNPHFSQLFSRLSAGMERTVSVLFLRS